MGDLYPVDEHSNKSSGSKMHCDETLSHARVHTALTGARHGKWTAMYSAMLCDRARRQAQARDSECGCKMSSQYCKSVVSSFSYARLRVIRTKSVSELAKKSKSYVIRNRVRAFAYHLNECVCRECNQCHLTKSCDAWRLYRCCERRYMVSWAASNGAHAEQAR
jgi:hypothetical protein